MTAEVILWLSLFAVCWVFFEPSRIGDEMLHDARRRVAWGIIFDPLFWVMLLLVILSALRWINSDITLAYDVENTRWYMREPMLSLLPGAAVGRGKIEFAVTVAVCIVVLGIRHSLGKAARLSFIFVSSFLAGVAAIIATVTAAYCGGVALALAKGSFANPSFTGGTFALYGFAAIVALAGSFVQKWKHTGFVSALAIGGTFAGAFVFAPAAPVLLYAAVAAVTLLICMGWVGAVSRSINVMRLVAIFIMGVAIAAVVVICLAPNAIVESRTAEITALSLFPKNFVEVRAILSRIALDTWLQAKWLGSGLGTFAYQTRFLAAPDDWSVIVMARPAALSAWWTLIAERGLIGAITLAVPLCFLLFTIFRRIPGAVGKTVFLPGCWLGVAVLGVAVAESFMDVSFLRPEALLTVVAFVAIAGGSLPPVKKSIFAQAQADW